MVQKRPRDLRTIALTETFPLKQTAPWNPDYPRGHLLFFSLFGTLAKNPRRGAEGVLEIAESWLS